MNQYANPAKNEDDGQHQPREHAVPCKCGKLTFNWSGNCRTGACAR